MEAKYNLKHAKEILEHCTPKGYLRFDERGVWPDIERDLLLQTETEGLRWRPARQLQHLPGAPEVKDTPMLPNPFTARELAAFMLDGTGSLVAHCYGERDDGPDPDSLRAIDPDSKARRAVTEAFTAYREAEGIVGPYPRALQADADRARKAYNEANQRANEREGVSGAVPGTDDSTARRARAVASVAAQEAKMHTTIAASRQASEAWLTKMVRCLLEPQAAAPAPEVAESASKAVVVPFKKAALIAAHVHEWPTIERDIADANTNGLAAAAKAGARGWKEDAALVWARANGKLISAAKPANSLAQAMHNLGSLPHRKHTIQG